MSTTAMLALALFGALVAFGLWLVRRQLVLPLKDEPDVPAPSAPAPIDGIPPRPELVPCPDCHGWYSRRGLNRHRTAAHKRHEAKP